MLRRVYRERPLNAYERFLLALKHPDPRIRRAARRLCDYLERGWSCGDAWQQALEDGMAAIEGT